MGRYETHKRYAPSNYALNQKIKRIQNDIEVKYKDTLISAGGAAVTAGVNTLLNGIGTGEDASNRTGAEVNATSIQFKGKITIVPEEGFTQGVCRMIIFWDQQPNGALPVISANPGAGSEALLNTAIVTSRVYAPYQYETNHRFRVLYDKIYQLNPTSSTTSVADFIAAPYNIVVKKKIPLSRKVKYDGTTNAITNLVTNSLICVIIADQPTDNMITAEIGFRFYYKDA